MGSFKSAKKENGSYLWSYCLYLSFTNGQILLSFQKPHLG